MATLTITDQLTSLEVAKRSGVSPDSRRIIEELTAYNELLLDAPLVEANEGTVDTHLVRTAIPHGQHRAYNEGVGQGSSQTKTIQDVISNIEIYSEVDKQLVDEAAHPKELMQSEQNAFIEGLSQDITDDLVYGNHNDDPRFTNGLATRLNSTNAGANKYCISMGGSNSGHLTSIYLIKWGMDKARIIYPRGSKNAGVEYNFLGQQTAIDGNNNKHEVYRAHYRVARGLSVGHSASIIRLCNIDITASNIGTAIAEKIVRVMPLLARGAGTVSIACNAEIKGLMNVTAINKTNILLPSEDPWGNEVLRIGNARFRECPSILMTEATVS
ncbi:MAG: hypothetical protein J6S85_01765 [Methanobrevibacter sp.]|nr:hypothetical protein [Methanobrevibacter sp.]MBO7712262.1 hypothetical protein [Methanobrevibacter sp.]